MRHIWIIGGTTEGRLLAEFCEENRIYATVSVVSGYGESLLPEGKYITCKTRAMDENGMEQFLLEEDISLVVDAAHPFARDVHQNIREACRKRNIRCIRCLREEADAGEKETEHPAEIYRVKSVREAAEYLAGQKGNILVTTGSHSLREFQVIPDWETRVFARVLPSSEVLRSCEELGFSGRQLIAMQGPFSGNMNEALLRETEAKWLVTKESGKAGGFGEKLAAAARTGAGTVVIEKPEETGLSLEEVKAILRWDIILAGIGPGSPEEMTPEVREAIGSADILIGARRMLETAKALRGTNSAEYICEYWPGYVLEILKNAAPGVKILLLYSGDTAFYSGAEKMEELLRAKNIPCRILRGLSSVSYFLKKLGIAPEESAFASVHAGEKEVKELLESAGEKRYLTVLCGRSMGIRELCRALIRLGYGTLQVFTGECLSYPEERIRRGTAEEMAEETYDMLSILCIDLGKEKVRQA